MPAIIVPGAIKRNVYLFSDDHTEKRDTHLPDVEWVNDEIEAEETRAKAAEATLQANIDAEETRAKAAEATKENLSNKVTSTATYVSDDTHYATTKTVDQRIAEVSPPEVKWATYDDTDFWTLEEWMDDGLLVLCNYSDHIYVATWKDTQTVNFASLLSDQTFADAYHLTCNSRWGWEDGVTNLEVMNNKQTSDTSWFSNDALYPTTAAVEDYVSKHTVHVFVRGGDEVLADVQAAFDAGEVCVCYDEDEGIYMQLINLSDWQASFAAVDSSHWLYNTAAWEDEWDDCWTNHLLLENHVNVSTETWYSSDNYIPSNKAVENYVASHSGCKVQVAEYGVTTFATIKSWYDAGNEVICKYGDHLYHLGTCLAFRAVFAAVPNNNAANQNLTSDNLIVTSSGWSTLQQSIETMNHRVDTYASWPASGSTSYPTTTAVEGYVAAHAPSGVEWATYGTTTYSQIKSWNDAGKPVFLKYTVSGPVNYIMKLTIVTPGGAFFCGVQGGSVYAAEVNPANQWSYNTSYLQASNLVHEYETWDATNDTGYPSVKAVTKYVSDHAGGGGLHVFTRGGTEALAEVQAAFDAGEVCVCYDEDENVYMQLVQLTDWQASFVGVDSNRWLYNTAAWDGEWDDCWTNNILIDAYKTTSTDTWTSSDAYIPSNKAVENYVASHGGGDVYEISCAGEIPIPCDSCTFNDGSGLWEVKFNGSGTMYSPRIIFKLLKNGNELQLNSNVKIVAEPYVSSGTKTYSSGEYFNAPSDPNWGQMYLDSYPSASAGKYFGIKLMQSSASTSPNNSSIYLKYPGGGSYTGASGLDSTKCYFVLSLYDKTVSQTVPVARKVIQIVPTYMHSSS